jgi:DNA-binding helix-hairpin-helix protein with protein kinase domain
MIFFDGQGRRVRLGDEFARGGEGAVFNVEGDSRLLAKLYLRPLNDEKRRKLSWMAAHGTSALFEQTAWPRATLHRAPGQAPVGFLMPRIQGSKPVHLLYSPASRANEFPDRDWGFLLTVASNIACVFEAVHSAGHLVGDVNERNLLVAPGTGTARLIDCDSFQVRGDGVVYPCEVGVARFTPPELQNRHLRVERSSGHDAFGLAVLLFHLVYLGRHPFDGVYLGHGEMTSERAIAEFRFAYGRDAAARQIKPPPIHLPFKAAPLQITELFERAFSPAAVKGGRPTASEWSAALRSAASSLRQCGVDRLHVFSAELAGCPWCQLTVSTGAVFFVAVDSFDFKCNPSDISAFLSFARETQTHWFLSPAPAPAPMPEGQMPRPVAAELNRLRLLSRARFAAGLAVVGSWNLFLFGSLRAGLATLAVTAAALGVLAVLLRAASKRSEALRLLRARSSVLVKATANLLQAQDGYLRCAWSAASRFKAHLSGIEALRADYESLEARFNEEREGFAARREELQRKEYLRKVFLAPVQIQGLGPGHKQVLRSFGIETAHDVLYAMPEEIKGLGEVRRGRLLDWARGAQREFHFDPKGAIPPADVRALVTRYRKEQVSIRARLEDACERLRRASNEMSHEASIARERVAVCERAVGAARAILPVSDESLKRITRRRFYERGVAWGVLAATCAASGIVYAIPSPRAEAGIARGDAEEARAGHAENAGRAPQAMTSIAPRSLPDLSSALPSDCTLYAGPDAESARLDELRKGTKLIVETRNGDGWMRVRTASQTVGWTSPACWTR